MSDRLRARRNTNAHGAMGVGGLLLEFPAFDIARNIDTAGEFVYAPERWSISLENLD